MYSLKKHGFVAAYDHSPIVRILVRDGKEPHPNSRPNLTFFSGIVYFLCTTFSNLFNVFVWYVPILEAYFVLLMYRRRI